MFAFAFVVLFLFYDHVLCFFSALYWNYELESYSLQVHVIWPVHQWPSRML